LYVSQSKVKIKNMQLKRKKIEATFLLDAQEMTPTLFLASIGQQQNSRRP
jgi:hypothetical protein